MTKTDAIAKVRKLQRVAAGAANVEEARTAGRIAGELIAAHHITPAELEGPPAAGAADATERYDFGFGSVEFTGAGGPRVRVGTFEGDLDSFLVFLYEAAKNAPSSAPTPGKGHRARPLTPDAARDHREHPNRVHLAVNDMRAVCGIGPTFVWTFERAVAIRSGEPCPHCMGTGVIDARNPQLTLPRHRLRDAKGRWV